MKTNYFKLLTTTNWHLYLYRVDFKPYYDRPAIRKGLLKPHKDAFGPYIFDGTLLYVTKELKQVRYFSVN